MSDYSNTRHHCGSLTRRCRTCQNGGVHQHQPGTTLTVNVCGAVNGKSQQTAFTVRTEMKQTAAPTAATHRPSGFDLPLAFLFLSPL